MPAQPRISRRKMLLASTTVTGTLLLIPTVERAAMSDDTKPKPPRPPALKPELVKEFVKAAHTDFERVKAMLTEEPALLNATWDWSGGDFESAIGGAGHMGRRDIALYLLEKGARMDIFVAAMLGELKIVKAMLDVFPNLLQSPGPHGIPLLAHAKAGGDTAKPVQDYLTSLLPKKEN
ncbi:hypothetical protein LBMAG21_15840 [Armatimonadota bacterium]|nr:hypothetical protein LBMAG21_15840 [Armatimonadota bacterium]